MKWELSINQKKLWINGYVNCSFFFAPCRHFLLSFLLIWDYENSELKEKALVEKNSLFMFDHYQRLKAFLLIKFCTKTVDGKEFLEKQENT